MPALVVASGRNESPAAAGRRAFTLIELLVVIAIIGLLISILVPSLSAARERGRAALCGSNLRQLGVGLSSYTDDNDGYYPGHHRSTGDWAVVWPTRLRRYVGDMTAVFNCPSNEYYFHWTPRYRPGSGPAMYGYLDNEVRLVYTSGFSYGYNDWGVLEFTIPHLGLGGWVDDPDHRDWGEVKVSEVVVPSDMIALADSSSDFWWDTAIDPGLGGTTEFPSRRHFGGSEVLSCDGHVEWISQTRLTARTAEMRARWNRDHQPHFEY